MQINLQYSIFNDTQNLNCKYTVFETKYIAIDKISTVTKKLYNSGPCCIRWDKLVYLYVLYLFIRIWTKSTFSYQTVT